MKFFSKYLIISVFLAILIAPSFVSARTAADLQAQIQALLAQISALQAQLVQMQGQPATWCHDFNNNLAIGSSGSEVEDLRTILEKEGFKVEIGGFNESMASAISGFQQKYKDEILAPWGLQYGTGFVGSTTRAKLNKLYGCGVITPTPILVNQPPVISGVSGPTTLNVGQTGTWTVKASDPEQGVLTYQVLWGDEAVGASAQLSQPLTYYVQTATFTHSYSKDGIYNPTFTVTDNQNLSAKTSISVNVGAVVVQPSIVVLSPNGGEVWEIGKTYTIKWSMADLDLSPSTFTISLIQNGSTIPIITNISEGSRSVNWIIPNNILPETYYIEVSIVHPKSGVKIIDTSDAPFSIVAAGVIQPAIKISASSRSPTGEKVVAGSQQIVLAAYDLDTSGSSEDVKISSVKLNYSFSSQGRATDLTNCKFYDGLTSLMGGVNIVNPYYQGSYIFNFDSPLVIPKNAIKAITLKCDISPMAISSYQWAFTEPPSVIGMSGATAKVTMSAIYSNINVISNGSLSVQKGNIMDQNIIINTSNQALGGFAVDVIGENILVRRMTFNFKILRASGLNQGVNDITNIILVDENNNIVAGPFDGVGTGVDGTVTFTDSVSFPIGKHQYVLKGYLSSDFQNNDKITVSAIPSANWTSVVGQISGVSITPLPNTIVTANTMTVNNTTASSITVVSPNGGEKWEVGKTYNIQWKTNNLTSKYVEIELFKDGKLYRGLFCDFCSAGGDVSQNYETGTFSANWTVPQDLPQSSEYLIKISDNANKSYVYDYSDAPFSIVAAGTTGPKLTVGLNSLSFVSNTVVAGTQSYAFGNYNLDASQSSEDIKVISVNIDENVISGTAITGLTNCALYDGPLGSDNLGTVRLNTGANTVNPSGTNTYTFRFDSPLIVSKGIMKSLTLKCDIGPSASGSSYRWVVYNDTKVNAVGATSGNVPAIVVQGLSGNIINVISNSMFTVVLDASSPSAKTVAAGSTNVTATVLKFTAAHEAIALQQVALQFDGSNVSAVQKYTIWDGATKVGEGLFAGTSKISTVVFPLAITIPKDSSKILTIKVDISLTATNGSTIAINYDGDNWQNTRGVGLSSGIVIFPIAKTDTAASKITVGSPATPSIAVVSPNGGEVWGVGKTYEITWTPNRDDMILSLLDSNKKYITTIVQYVASPYKWTIPSTVALGQYYIQISHPSLVLSDTSDAPFTVATWASVSQTTSLNQMASVLESAKAILNQLLQALKNF